MPNIIVSNLEKEEDIAKQRCPITDQIYAEVQRRAEASKDKDSPESVLSQVLAFGSRTGPRAGEIAQTTQTKVDYHIYPSGAKVIRAFVPDDFEFYDKNGRRILTIDETSLDNLGHMFAQWKRQKNGQNGQKRMIQADHKHPRLCPVRNALLLILRKMRLGHSMLLPIAIFKNKKGEVKYLIGSKIAEILQKANNIFLLRST